MCIVPFLGLAFFPGSREDTTHSNQKTNQHAAKSGRAKKNRGGGATLSSPFGCFLACLVVAFETKWALHSPQTPGPKSRSRSQVGTGTMTSAPFSVQGWSQFRVSGGSRLLPGRSAFRKPRGGLLSLLPKLTLGCPEQAPTPKRRRNSLWRYSPITMVRPLPLAEKYGGRKQIQHIHPENNTYFNTHLSPCSFLLEN